MKNPFHKKEISPQEAFIRSFLACIAPGVVKFEVDHYIFGNTYRCVWALREYPASTESQAILRHLGEKSGVTLRIYCRQVSPGEEDRIIDNANKKNKLDGSDPNKLRQAVEAESNLRDVAELVHKMHREHEPLLHCAVYLEMTADSAEHLRQLQTDVLTELVRCKLNVDKLLLRQKQGFCCASPVGYNALGREFERVLPAGSVANLYPFNYSGKTDPNGIYIGKDKYGSNIVVDFDRRDSDKTSANILILGNSGQGKSYLMPAFDVEALFSAGRSRGITLVPIIQSLAQLEKNYGREGAEILTDNCQDTIFGGFAPNSQTAEQLSKSLGSRTVLSGSVSKGKNDPSQSLQMMERPLMTPDELKSIPKGSFVVMKTGTHPMQTKLRLFLDWGITFGEPYATPEHATRLVAYASRAELLDSIDRTYPKTQPVLAPATGKHEMRRQRSGQTYEEGTP